MGISIQVLFLAVILPVLNGQGTGGPPGGSGTGSGGPPSGSSGSGSGSGSGGGTGTMQSGAPSISPTSAPSSTPLSLIDYACQHNESWMLNTNGHRNSHFGSKTDILSSTYSSLTNRWTVKNPNIPNYDRTFTSADIEALNSRPRTWYDFANGKNTTAKAGKKYAFGDNIGYITDNGCSLGYWPPGPTCPSAQNTTMTYTLTPAEEKTPGGCYYTAYSSYAYMVNGVALFYWGDTTTYNFKGVWNNLAVTFEIYDLDICLGHAAMGTYHHHSYSPCLMAKLGDNGTDGHSPIHAWAPDGFPVYGPYQDTGVLATPCWQKRDYSVGSATGCGKDGQRTCTLTDQYDYTKGVTKLSPAYYGPNITDVYVSQSGNHINVSSGAYFEDYYFNQSCYELGGEYLNENNGHAHDGLGFHYHMTMDETGLPIFPYAIGPKLYGCVSTGECKTSFTMSSPGGSSGGPGGSSGGPGSLAGTTGGTSGPPGGSSGSGSSSGGPPGGSSGGSSSSSSKTSTCGVSLGKTARNSKCIASANLPTKSPTVSVSTSAPTAGTVVKLSMNVTQTLSGFSSTVRNLTLSQRRSFNYAVVSALESKGLTVSSITIYRVSNSASDKRRLLLGGSTLYVTYGFSTTVPYLYMSAVSSNVTNGVTLLASTVQDAVSGPTFLAVLQSNDSSTFGSVTVTSVSVTTKTNSVTVYTSSPTQSPTHSPTKSPTAAINKPAIIGGVIGGFFGAVLIAVAAYFFCVRNRSPSADGQQVVHAGGAGGGVPSAPAYRNDGGVMMQPIVHPAGSSGKFADGTVANPIDAKGRYV